MVTVVVGWVLEEASDHVIPYVVIIQHECVFCSAPTIALTALPYIHLHSHSPTHNFSIHFSHTQFLHTFFPHTISPYIFPTHNIPIHFYPQSFLHYTHTHSHSFTHTDTHTHSPALTIHLSSHNLSRITLTSLTGSPWDIHHCVGHFPHIFPSTHHFPLTPQLSDLCSPQSFPIYIPHIHTYIHAPSMSTWPFKTWPKCHITYTTRILTLRRFQRYNLYVL